MYYLRIIDYGIPTLFIVINYGRHNNDNDKSGMSVRHTEETSHYSERWGGHKLSFGVYLVVGNSLGTVFTLEYLSRKSVHVFRWLGKYVQ